MKLDGAGAKIDDTESESDDEDDLISQIVAQKSPTRITMKLHVTDKISSSWDSVSIGVSGQASVTFH